jgi:hypothetical protein
MEKVRPTKASVLGKLNELCSAVCKNVKKTESKRERKLLSVVNLTMYETKRYIHTAIESRERAREERECVCVSLALSRTTEPCTKECIKISGLGMKVS